MANVPVPVLTRRTVCSGLGAMLFAGCTGTRQQRAAAAAPPVEYPIVYDEHGGLFVEATIAGRGPVRLILDTGAERSALATAFAEQLGQPLLDGGEVEGAAGTVRARSVVARVDVASLAGLDVDFAVYPFGSYDVRCVGILGAEFLRLEPFQLRYRDRVLRWRAERPRRTIAMVLDHRIPRVEAVVNGQPVDLRIDTGASLAPCAESYCNLAKSQAGRLGLTGRPQMVFTASGTGGAALELPVYALRSLVLAGRELPRPFAIVQPQAGYFARDDAVGFLGNPVLDKVDPFLDYAAGVFGVPD